MMLSPDCDRVTSLPFGSRLSGLPRGVRGQETRAQLRQETRAQLAYFFLRREGFRTTDGMYEVNTGVVRLTETPT
jgi:hypothetical protein